MALRTRSKWKYVLASMRVGLPQWVCVLLIGLLTGCGNDTRVCFGSDVFCAFPPDPIADAGPNLEVGSGETVTLDGSASDAPRSHIRSFSWVQVDGPTVSISNANRAVATFVAPDVNQSVDLVFRLTVVNDAGAADSDTARATVEPRSRTASRAVEALLQRDLLPAPLGDASACFVHGDGTAAITDGEIAVTALWLWAGASRAQAGRAASDEFLDRARVLIGWLESAVQDPHTMAAALTAAAAATLEEVTSERDPGLAAASAGLRARLDGAAVDATLRAVAFRIADAESRAHTAATGTVGVRDVGDPLDQRRALAEQRAIMTARGCANGRAEAMDPLQTLSDILVVSRTE